jgi:hypothetical protein
VIVRGAAGTDTEEKEFMREVLEEVRQERITEAQLAAEVGGDAVERGVLNWNWVRASREPLTSMCLEVVGPALPWRPKTFTNT